MSIAHRLAVSLTLVFLAACASAPPQPDDPTLREWTQLVDGNASFKRGPITFPGWTGRIDPQNPPIAMLTCSDSRVPPELVFHQNLDRLFIVRSAGNIADTFGIASIEYAITKKWPKLLVVLAHEKCGAVEEAINADPPPEESSDNVEALLEKIQESFQPPHCTLDDACWLRRTRENAVYAVEDLKKNSDVIRKAIDVDKLPVVVAYYDLNGNVTVWQSINIAIPAQP